MYGYNFQSEYAGELMERISEAKLYNIAHEGSQIFSDGQS